MHTHATRHLAPSRIPLAPRMHNCQTPYSSHPKTKLAHGNANCSSLIQFSSLVAPQYLPTIPHCSLLFRTVPYCSLLIVFLTVPYCSLLHIVLFPSCCIRCSSHYYYYDKSLNGLINEQKCSTPVLIDGQVWRKLSHSKKAAHIASGPGANV